MADEEPTTPEPSEWEPISEPVNLPVQDPEPPEVDNREAEAALAAHRKKLQGQGK